MRWGDIGVSVVDMLGIETSRECIVWLEWLKCMCPPLDCAKSIFDNQLLRKPRVMSCIVLKMIRSREGREDEKNLRLDSC